MGRESDIYGGDDDIDPRFLRQSGQSKGRRPKRISQSSGGSDRRSATRYDEDYVEDRYDEGHDDLLDDDAVIPLDPNIDALGSEFYGDSVARPHVSSGGMVDDVNWDDEDDDEVIGRRNGTPVPEQSPFEWNSVAATDPYDTSDKKKGGKVTKISLAVLGVAAVSVIGYSAIPFNSSGGDPAPTVKAAATTTTENPSGDGEEESSGSNSSGSPNTNSPSTSKNTPASTVEANPDVVGRTVTLSDPGNLKTGSGLIAYYNYAYYADRDPVNVIDTFNPLLGYTVETVQDSVSSVVDGMLHEAQITYRGDNRYDVLLVLTLPTGDRYEYQQEYALSKKDGRYFIDNKIDK